MPTFNLTFRFLRKNSLRYSRNFATFSAIATLLISVVVFSSKLTAQETPSPLNDALYRWTFATPNESNGTLVPNGPARLGVELSGAELAESKARGGDGKVAKIESGGYLAFEPNPDFQDELTSTEQTFYIRVKSDVNQPNYPIFSRYGGHERLSFNFFYLNAAWGFEFGTTKNNGLLRTNAPVAETLSPETVATDWVDLVARVTDAKLEFFLNGRCVDEDFVLGVPRKPQVGILFGAQYDADGKSAATGFSGQIDAAAVWNRALTDAEIEALCGGAERVDVRTRVERDGAESLQYWLPPNAYGVGDCMPFTVDGVFHFMYLLDKNRHGAKNGFGAHQWLQATSTDLKNWKHERPFVVPIDAQSEGSICTGSVFYHKGKYYAFYGERSIDWTAPDGSVRSPFGLICVATSDDGIHFEKSEKNPLFYLPDDYGWGTRDPVVVQDPKTQRFIMYLTTSRNGRGCLARLSSDDLFDWKLEEPVYARRGGEPECPDLFEWGGRWYLIVGHLNGYYRVADSPLGPWEEPAAPNVVMPGIVNVPKSAPWKDDRRIVCAWSRNRGFGGRSVFHELVLRDDGTLGEKFVPEMIPQTSAPVVDEKNVANAEKTWPQLPAEYRLKATLTFDANAVDSLRGVEISFADDKKLIVDPATRSVRLGEFLLEKVDFSTGETRLDVVICGDLIDVCVNDDRAVIDAISQTPERSATLKNLDANRLQINDLIISPIIGRR